MEIGTIVALAGVSASLGSLLTKAVDHWLAHRRGLARLTLEEQEALLKQSAALRQELRQELERLQARVDELERQVEVLRRENARLRRLLAQAGVQGSGT